MKIRNIALSALFVLASTISYANEPMRLVPQNSKIAMELDYAQAMTQPEIKDLISSQIASGSDISEEVLAKIGINPSKDIKNIHLFVDEANNCGIIISGSFDAAKISEVFQTDKELTAKFQMKNIGEAPTIVCNANENANIMLIDQNTMVLGNEAVLTKVASVNDSKTPNIETDEEFVALLKDNRPSSGLWGVVRPEKAQDENKLLPGLENMKISMFKLFYDKNFDFSFVGRVGSEKDAEALKQNLQNLLDMAKAGVVNEKEATELLKAVEVKSTADSASMVLSVPAETMKAFLVRLATPASK